MCLLTTTLTSHFFYRTIDKTAGYKRSSVYNLIKSTEATKENFVVKTNSFVTKILTWGIRRTVKPKAYGVQVEEGSGLYGASPIKGISKRKVKYFARKEVIVAGGTFNTPQILMVSGIGPKEELEAHGIKVVADVPGVGKNLRDKLEATMNFRIPMPWQLFDRGCTTLRSQPSAHRCFFDYLQGGNFTDAPNPYTSNSILLSVQKKSNPSLPRPDMYLQIAPFSFQGFRDGWIRQGLGKSDFVTFNILTTTSVGNAGTVSLKSKNPFEPVSIDFNGYADEDLERAAKFVEELRSIAEELQAAGVIEEIVEPGPERSETMEDLKNWTSDRGWGHHACCTAKIGDDDDPMAVLDGQLKVRAVDRLRVVDLSAFPVEPGFFPMLPVYLLAEKAAEDIIASSTSILDFNRDEIDDTDEDIMNIFAP